MNDLAAIPGAGFSVVNWGYPAVPTLVWNGIYNSPAFASIQAPSPYELDIGGISGTSQLLKVVRNQSSAYVQFGGEVPVYSSSGFSGSGAWLTSLNGAAITPGSVNFSAFDAATAAQLAPAGSVAAGVTNQWRTDATNAIAATVGMIASGTAVLPAGQTSVTLSIPTFTCPPVVLVTALGPPALPTQYAASAVVPGQLTIYASSSASSQVALYWLAINQVNNGRNCAWP